MAQRDPYQEAWRGDGLEWRLWDFDTLDKDRERPPNWKSRVTSEDQRLDMELCGLNIDLEKLEMVLHHVLAGLGAAGTVGSTPLHKWCIKHGRRQRDQGAAIKLSVANCQSTLRVLALLISLH